MSAYYTIRIQKKRAYFVALDDQQLYLETHSNLKVAMKLYEKQGFREIEKPEAAVHGTMDHFYFKKL